MKLFNWLFRKKKLKVENCINIDCSEGRHKIFLFVNNRFFIKDYVSLIKQLNTDKNIVFDLIEDLQLTKVIHIKEKT